MTKGELIEKLKMYPDTMDIVSHNGQNFIHIVNNQNDTIILSTLKPQGYCNNCGDYVYPEVDKDIDYPYICPTCDENKYGIEVTSLKK